jgi:hypothetical protein
MADLGQLTLETFSGHLGDPFLIRPAAPTQAVPPDFVVEGRLIEAEALGEAPAAGLRAPFSLVFSGASEPILGQGVWRVEHAALGTIELFLVPLQPQPDGARYQVIFN